MSTLTRLNKLKGFNYSLSSGLLESNAYQSIDPDYIGPRGLTKRDIYEKIVKMKSCCDTIDLLMLPDDRVKLHSGNFCKQHVICSNCADRIQSLRRKRFGEPIKELSKRCIPDAGKARLWPYFLTFTIRAGEDILTTHTRLKRSMLNFRRMGQKRVKRDKITREIIAIKKDRGEWSKVVAGIGTHEIIRGEGGKPHSHCHMIVFTDEPFNYRVYDQEKRRALEALYGRGNIPEDELKKIQLNSDGFSKISREWNLADGDAENFKVIPIERVPREASDKTRNICQGLDLADSINYQAREVLKYVSKLNKNDHDFTIDLINKTHNLRFFEAFGLFRGLSDDNNYEESEATKKDLLESTGLMRYRWNGDGEYSDQSAIEDSGRLEFSGAVYFGYQFRQNIIIGEYRTARRIALEGGASAPQLDSLRDNMRTRINELWATYANEVKRIPDVFYRAHDLKVPTKEDRKTFVPYDVHLHHESAGRMEELKNRFRSYLDKKLYSVTYTPGQIAAMMEESIF